MVQQQVSDQHAGAVKLSSFSAVIVQPQHEANPCSCDTSGTLRSAAPCTALSVCSAAYKPAPDCHLMKESSPTEWKPARWMPREDATFSGAWIIQNCSAASCSRMP